MAVINIPYYPLQEFKSTLQIEERFYDSEGRPFQIVDDDLDEIFSRSDFAQMRRQSR